MKVDFRGGKITTTKKLYSLQELDWEIDRFQARLASVEEQIADESNLVKARQSVEIQKNAITQLKNKQNLQGLDLQTTEERVEALNERLYGGSVKSPREMQSSIAELESAKEGVSQMEEQLLDLMVKLDEAEHTIEKSTQQLSIMETDRENLLVNLGMERKTLLTEIQLSTEKREIHVVNIEAEHLVLYERIRKARKGSAIARAESGMCQGCHLKLTTRQMQQLRSSDELVQCNSCTRIFYLS